MKMPKDVVEVISRMTGYGPTLAKTLEAARLLGRQVVYPKENQLFIDIDSEEDLAVFRKMFPVLGQAFYEDSLYPIPHAIRPSASGVPGRYHITVDLPRDISDLERVCLQACLGSDRMREILSWFRYSNDEDRITVFFEKKEAGA